MRANMNICNGEKSENELTFKHAKFIIITLMHKDTSAENRSEIVIRPVA